MERYAQADLARFSGNDSLSNSLLDKQNSATHALQSEIIDELTRTQAEKKPVPTPNIIQPYTPENFSFPSHPDALGNSDKIVLTSGVLSSLAIGDMITSRTYYAGIAGMGAGLTTTDMVDLLSSKTSRDVLKNSTYLAADSSITAAGLACLRECPGWVKLAGVAGITTRALLPYFFPDKPQNH